MKRLRLGAVVAAAVLAVSCLAGSASAASAPADAGPHYYVSLGDSLAAGYQPDAHKNVAGVSYTDQLYASMKQTDPGLVHVQFGCSGETTTTMIDGGVCSYDGQASQLDAATAFLRAHRGRVTVVTLDIGANDVDGCFAVTGIDTSCVVRGIGTVARNVPRIARALRTAGGSRPEYAGMTYYDPFLAVWLTGAAGHTEATASVPLADALNVVLFAGLALDGFRVADVAGAFHTNDFAATTAPQIGSVPTNVATVCGLTWMCTPYRDIHATPAGHAVLADAFRTALR